VKLEKPENDSAVEYTHVSSILMLLVTQAKSNVTHCTVIIRTMEGTYMVIVLYTTHFKQWTLWHCSKSYKPVRAQE
jgi:hypothetical protein